MGSFKSSALAAFGRPALTSALIVGLYYVVPVTPGAVGAWLAVRIIGAVVVGLLVTWLIVQQVSHQFADPEEASLIGLLTAIVGGVVFFALADYTIAVLAPGQFVGLTTRTDALYFALATLTTVGYGDIHPVGQVARATVAVQLVFNVVVIATGASVLIRQIGARARVRHAAKRQPAAVPDDNEHDPGEP
jgi:voltage-gated potassium channel